MGCAFNIGTFINAIAPKIGNAFLAALLKNSLLDWIFSELSISNSIKCYCLTWVEHVPLQLPLHDPLQVL